MGTRALSLILVSTGLQLGAAGAVAAATAEEGAPDPSAPAAAPTAPGPVASAPSPTPAAPPPARPLPAATASPQAPASVTISRAGSSAFRSVSIVDFAFDPTALTVKVGDTIQWINNGTDEDGHNVVGDGLASPVLHTGESYSFTFSEAGSFSYICTIHPKMTGTVEVIDPTADDPGKVKKTKKGKRGKSASPSASGAGSSGAVDASGSATSSGSESAAGRSAKAAGTSGSLPATGSDSIGLAIAGLALVGFGLALRRPRAGGTQRSG
jgi:LPXTG-motif cell wall-anchored protein